MKIARLAYLLAQHPLHLHRALVRRGLALKWIDDFCPFWDTVRPPSLPISDYASFTWLEYHFTQLARAKYPVGDHFEDMDWQYARLLSYVKRREMHPLRMLTAAWHLRRCAIVLEYGAGAAPYAYLVQRLGLRQTVYLTDLPGLLQDYCRWQFRAPQFRVFDAEQAFQRAGDRAYSQHYGVGGIVATEVFEHLPDPSATALHMTTAAPLVCFDYVDDGTFKRRATLDHFKRRGTLTGPDQRGLYVWRA
jgi:hypothetical protein